MFVLGREDCAGKATERVAGALGREGTSRWVRLRHWGARAVALEICEVSGHALGACVFPEDSSALFCDHCESFWRQWARLPRRIPVRIFFFLKSLRHLSDLRRPCEVFAPSPDARVCSCVAHRLFKPNAATCDPNRTTAERKQVFQYVGFRWTPAHQYDMKGSEARRREISWQPSYLAIFFHSNLR